jgi:hypothetical protein
MKGSKSMSVSNSPPPFNFIPPNVEDVLQYAIKLGYSDFNAVYFCESQTRKKWLDNAGKPIRYWHGAVQRLCSSKDYIRIDEYAIRTYLLNNCIYWIDENNFLNPKWLIERLKKNKRLNWIDLANQKYRELRAEKQKEQQQS